MSAHSGGKPPDASTSTPIRYIANDIGSDMEMDSPINGNNLVRLDNQKNIIENTIAENVSTTNLFTNSSLPQNESNEEINENNGIKKLDTQKKRAHYLYEYTDTGPYFVYIESSLGDFTGKLNPMKVGEILFKKLPEIDNKIINIESIGRNRIRIKIKDWRSANILLNSNILSEFNLKQYIPKFILHRYGIIKGVDLEYDDEYIRERIKPLDMQYKFTVDSAKRLNRKESNPEADGAKKLIPTKTVLIIFKTQVLPKYISINHVRFEVLPYEQKVLLCYNCFRYGHLGKQCKANVRCLNCKQQHRTDDCTLAKNPKCFYCEGKHFTNETNKCPEFVRQKNLKKLIVEQNLTYAEANLKIPKNTYATVVNNQNPNIPKVSTLNNPIASSSSISQTTSPSSQTLLPSHFQHHTSFQQSQSSYQREKTYKRPRYTSTQKEVIKAHEKIIEPVRSPSSSTPIFENSKYKLNISSSESGNAEYVNITRTSLINLIFSILHTLKEQKSLEIQESLLLNIIQKAVSDQVSDDELY